MRPRTAGMTWSLGNTRERHFRCVIGDPELKVKYELDKKTGLLWLDRVCQLAVTNRPITLLPQTFLRDAPAVNVLVWARDAGGCRSASCEPRPSGSSDHDGRQGPRR